MSDTKIMEKGGKRIFREKKRKKKRFIHNGKVTNKKSEDVQNGFQGVYPMSGTGD